MKRVAKVQTLLGKIMQNLLLAIHLVRISLVRLLSGHERLMLHVAAIKEAEEEMPLGECMSWFFR